MKTLNISRKGQQFQVYVDDKYYDLLSSRPWQIIQRRQHHSAWTWYDEPNCHKKDNYGAKRGKISMSQFVWYLEHGQVLEGKKITIDHIDRNPLNNQISNLRLANDIEQLKNRSIQPATGHRGITKRSSGRYQVRKTVDGKYKTIGTFNTLEEAIEAYEQH